LIKAEAEKQDLLFRDPLAAEEQVGNEGPHFAHDRIHLGGLGDDQGEIEWGLQPAPPEDDISSLSTVGFIDAILLRLRGFLDAEF